MFKEKKEKISYSNLRSVLSQLFEMNQDEVGLFLRTVGNVERDTGGSMAYETWTRLKEVGVEEFLNKLRTFKKLIKKVYD